MKQGINLSLGRKRVDNALKKIFYVTAGTFILTVVISLSLIIYRLVLKGMYDSLDQKEQKLNTQLLAMQDKKDKLIETKSRIADIQKVLSKRSPIVNRLETVSGVISSDSTVDAINGTDTDMQLTLESENLATLNDLIEAKIADLASDKKRGIKKIEMRSFGLNPKTLKYSLTFGVTFK
jgi:hypothetical protein